VQVGDVVAGKYRIEREIARGGMGVVMAARHLTLDQPVALKFVSGSDEGEAVERLVREARATFRLQSPHAVRVHDVGRIPSGPVYIVMELLEGKDLKALLVEHGPLPERDVVGYALDACHALEEAHAAGIVHRDLKPHNLFLTKSLGKPIVKVLDFGLSKLDEEIFEASPLTLPHTALGTPRYMAPEQWKSAAEVDLRADVWGLGMVMYELLTGKAPLQGMSWDERRARLLAGAIPSPREARPDISEPVARIIMKCLRPDLQARWQSAAHLAEALRGALLPAENPAPPARPRIGDDFDEAAATEVRPPVFSAEDLSGPAPVRVGKERNMAGTLRSEGVGPDITAAIAEAYRRAGAQATTADTAKRAGKGPRQATKPAPLAAPAPRRASFPVLVLVTIGLLGTAGAVAWLVMRMLAG
jgi:serine/threonine-protein kinase